ncbi:MAG: glycosyl hydrolase family 31, partial [Prevotella sp.]|nr:glycosyl hydrolase family 31 [Prevotella sp.]
MACLWIQAKDYSFGKGQISTKMVARNAVRISYTEGVTADTLPEWVYVKNTPVVNSVISVSVDRKKGLVCVKDKRGRVVFSATAHELHDGVATLRFTSPKDEYLYGLGQFQDGYTNIRGLSRRLTQVNTQISIPMLLSSKGYGVLWNNYGLTEYNPSRDSVRLSPITTQSSLSSEVVDVTTTEGGRKEVRQRHIFETTVDIPETGDYALLLDVGQKMARRHNLVVDGQTVIEMQNLWLPPTASTIVHLDKGTHQLRAELTGGDKPLLYYHQVQDQTVLRSPVATAVDYTVFVGSPDEVIATYRELTGPAPLMPQWMLGYIHCRERFHSQQEILQTANRFRQEQLPVDVLVQD